MNASGKINLSDGTVYVFEDEDVAQVAEDIKELAEGSRNLNGEKPSARCGLFGDLPGNLKEAIKAKHPDIPDDALYFADADPESLFLLRDESITGTCFNDDAEDDPVASPSHYKRGGVECKHVMAAMLDGLDLTPEQGYWYGCAIKYLWRWPKKNGLQDIAKCRECLHILMDTLEK